MYILDYIFNIRICTILNSDKDLLHIYIYKNNIKIYRTYQIREDSIWILIDIKFTVLFCYIY